MIFPEWLNLNNLSVVAYYGYTSNTTRNLAKFEGHKIYTDKLSDFETIIRNTALEVKSITKKMIDNIGTTSWDNKVVVECILHTHDNVIPRLYFGFYDGRISLGLGVHQHDRYRTDVIEFDEINISGHIIKKSVIAQNDEDLLKELIHFNPKLLLNIKTAATLIIEEEERNPREFTFTHDDIKTFNTTNHPNFLRKVFNYLNTKGYEQNVLTISDPVTWCIEKQKNKLSIKEPWVNYSIKELLGYMMYDLAEGGLLLDDYSELSTGRERASLTNLQLEKFDKCMERLSSYFEND